MPASSSLFKMNFSNTNQIYGNRNNNVNSSSRNNVKVGMDLNTAMIGRIKNAPVGCGACGK